MCVGVTAALVVQPAGVTAADEAAVCAAGPLLQLCVCAVVEAKLGAVQRAAAAPGSAMLCRALKVRCFCL